MDRTSSAPSYPVSRRDVVAVEHPMVIKNIDNGLKTFGRGKSFARIMKDDDPEGALPLYLRPNDPMNTPIMSKNAPTTNVLLKITVPKLTRKRKRGSQDPYIDIAPESAENDSSTQSNLRSHSRKDSAAHLMRSLKDNAGNYEIEAVAEIQRSHRFRTLTDFHHSTSHTEFSTKFQELVMPGDVHKMRQYKFNPSRGWKRDEEFMPPPVFTTEHLPFIWEYQQNHHIVMSVDEKTGKEVLRNRAKARTIPLLFCGAEDKSVPQSSTFPVEDDDAIRTVIQKLAEAMEERPVWTRRALANRIGHEALPVPISKALHHVAYQFKGGPFRDAVVKYGVDPRTDPKCRNYQTFFFQIFEGERGSMKVPQWNPQSMPFSTNAIRKDTTTHLFDGKTFGLDGKVWQVCDISEPFLKDLIENAPLRDDFDAKGAGWFCNGTWCKIQAIMRTMLIAIRVRVPLETLDFKIARQFPDIIEGNKRETRRITVPMPKIQLTAKKREELTREGMNLGFLEVNGLQKDSKQKHTFSNGKDLEVAKRKYFRNTALQGEKSSGATGTSSGAGSPENSQLQQATTPSDTSMTEKNGGAESGMESGDDDDEQESGDDDIEEGETDDAESNREDQEAGEDEEEYDSDTTDVLDPATYFKPRSRH